MSHNPPTLRVGIYTRLSRDRDGTQTATARQAADCRALAEREGWTVVDTYEDADLSGSRRGLIRPDYERLLDDLRTGRIEGIVVWKLDRLSRQPGQFEAIITACEATGARIASVHESADMTSPSGLAMMRVGMAFAALETDTLSLRLRRQKAEAADAGEPNGGGLRAFGHTANKREVVAFEAELVREAAARVLAGESLSVISRDWCARGVLTTRGNEWQITSLRKMLGSPRLYGARVHRDRVIDSESIPPILPRETWDEMQVVLGAQRLGRGEYTRRPSRALSGLIRCARCDARMQVNYRTNRQPLYRCDANPGRGGCGRMVISAAPAEEIVGGMLAEALDTDALADALAEGDTAAAEVARSLMALRTQREELVQDHYVTGLVSRGDFLPAHARLTDGIGAAEGRLARMRRHSSLLSLAAGESVADAWATRDHAWRRALAAACLDAVVIHAAPNRGSTRVDPARVELVWRS